MESIERGIEKLIVESAMGYPGKLLVYSFDKARHTLHISFLAAQGITGKRKRIGMERNEVG